MCPLDSLFPLYSVGPGIGFHIPPHTLPLCLSVFLVHQHSSVDRFVVHWYVVGLENRCQLFRKLTNTGQTYGVLPSVGVSGVDVFLISLSLHGVENHRFVAVRDS